MVLSLLGALAAASASTIAVIKVLVVLVVVVVVVDIDEVEDVSGFPTGAWIVLLLGTASELVSLSLAGLIGVSEVETESQAAGAEVMYLVARYAW